MHHQQLLLTKEIQIQQRRREWRQSGIGLINNAQPAHDPLPSPSVSASQKWQKIRQNMPSLSLGAPSPALHPQPYAASMQPSSSAAKRGPAPVARGTKGQLPSASSMKPMQYPSTGPSGRGQVGNKNSGALAATEPAEVAQYDPLIWRKVMTRWPEDNNFYDAMITDYSPTEGLHALVYDINTQNEAWEWVNLKEVVLVDFGMFRLSS